jgi:hypothetical protein
MRTGIDNGGGIGPRVVLAEGDAEQAIAHPLAVEGQGAGQLALMQRQPLADARGKGLGVELSKQVADGARCAWPKPRRRWRNWPGAAAKTSTPRNWPARRAVSCSA